MEPDPSCYVTTETSEAQAYQRYCHAAANRVRQHPLWQRATSTPMASKVTKYTLGSVVAFAMSEIVFLLAFMVGCGTTVCSVAGFVGGAIPNWILNRRWAWEQSGRASTKQVSTYVLVALVVLVSTSLITGWADHAARGISSHGLRGLFVTAVFAGVNVVFFAVKFVIYEYWVFHEHSRVRAGLRSLLSSSWTAR
jgi:putative flippase GtrA